MTEPTIVTGMADFEEKFGTLHQAAMAARASIREDEARELMRRHLRPRLRWLINFPRLLDLYFDLGLGTRPVLVA